MSNYPSISLEEKCERIKIVIAGVNNGGKLAQLLEKNKIPVGASVRWQENGFLIKDRRGGRNNCFFRFNYKDDTDVQLMADLAFQYKKVIKEKIVFSPGPQLPEGEKQIIIKHLASLVEWFEKFDVFFPKSHLAPIISENEKLKRELRERTENLTCISKIKEENERLKSDNIALRKSIEALLKGDGFKRS